jgi:branched-chain amino acid transport system substrate-binding protein
MKLNCRIAMVISVLAIFASGCSAEENLQLSRERHLTQASSEIVVGVSWPFESRNEGFKEGLELALNEINEKGLLGTKMKLLQEDDQNSVTVGLSIAQSFSENLDISAVIGHRSSGVAIPASKVYENAGLLYVAPGSTSPKLTEGEGFLFRTIPNDEQIGKAMATYAKNNGYEKIAIFYANDEYGRGLANSFEDSAKALEIQIVDRVSDYKNARDIQRIVDKWKLLNSDAVFVADAMPDGANFILQLRAAGMDVPIIGGDGMDSIDLLKLGGPAADNMVVASIFNPHYESVEVSQFVEKYKKHYGSEPTKWAAQGYDALHLLAYVIDKSNSRIPADIAVALHQLNSWGGVSGFKTFEKNGDVNDMKIVLKEVRFGDFVYIK